jgi:DNA-binding CsgD family transcriptional regulator
MGRSQGLRLGEVRALYRLVGECRELGDDVDGWRQHLAAGLCRLTTAQLCLVGECRLVGPERLMVPLDFVDHGHPTATARAFYLAWLKNPSVLDSELIRGFNRVPGRFVTRTREQFTDDRTWYASFFFNEAMRPSGLDSGLLSRYGLPGRDRHHYLVLNRLLGDRPFDRRSRRLVLLLHQEIVPHLGRGLATSEEPGASGLSPRLRQVLECLLDGDSEKQAAARLGVGVRTVHEYVVAVYRHFGVSSRGELFACFLRRFRGRPPTGRPRG